MASASLGLLMLLRPMPEVIKVSDVPMASHHEKTMCHTNLQPDAAFGPPDRYLYTESI